MTKKEKLINWAKENFENNSRGVVILLYKVERIRDDNYDTPCLVTKVQHCYNFNELLDFVRYYSDRLVHVTNEKPEPNEEFYDYELVDYNRNKERLKRYAINMEDVCIFGCYWQISGDIKYFGGVEQMTFKELRDREGVDKIIKTIKEERKRLLKKIFEKEIYSAKLSFYIKPNNSRHVPLYEELLCFKTEIDRWSQSRDEYEVGDDIEQQIKEFAYIDELEEVEFTINISETLGEIGNEKEK